MGEYYHYIKKHLLKRLKIRPEVLTIFTLNKNKSLLESFSTRYFLKFPIRCYLVSVNAEKIIIEVILLT
jgi:hypothetical protein